MLTLGFVLLVAGVVVGVGAFAYAALNIKKVFPGKTRPGSDRLSAGRSHAYRRSASPSLYGLFGGHLAAMIVMAFGGLISFTGVILILMVVLQNLLA